MTDAEEPCVELTRRLQRRDWQERPAELWHWVEATPGVERCIATGLRDAAAAEDWLAFEVLVLAGFRVPSASYVPILTEILDRRSHELNSEDVVELLHDVADPAAVPALERALWWLPPWDEFHALGRKCVEALAAVGTDEAWAVVKDAAEVGPRDIRAEAEAALARR